MEFRRLVSQSTSSRFIGACRPTSALIVWSAGSSDLPIAVYPTDSRGELSMHHQNELGQTRDHPLRAWLTVTALFLMLMALAALHQSVQAESDGNTVPPGGTISPAPQDGINGFVRVVHAAPFAPNNANTTVDICDENDQPIPGLTGLAYLNQSNYLPFAPGTYDWYVGTVGCGSLVVEIPAFNLFRDAALTLYILGDGGNQPLTTVLSVDRRGLDKVNYLPLLYNRFAVQ
jgi:hypothetical protein